MTSEYLFVYGTLRRGADETMHPFLKGAAHFVGAAQYQGRMYHVDTYPGVVPSSNPAHQVRGEVYALPEPESILFKLDQYEECGPGFPEPTEYIRERHAVELADGRSVKAWVYIYHRSIESLREMVSGDFLNQGDARIR